MGTTKDLNQPDNESYFGGEKSLALISSFFAENLPLFSLAGKHYDPSGYWSITFSNKDTTIQILSERGYLLPGLFVNSLPVSLMEFDTRVKALESASKTNIEVLLQIILNYLSGREKSKHNS